MVKSLPMRQLGFTLIELMVVIAIISILATVGLTVFSGTQQNARDTKRRQDIDAIADSIETVKGAGSFTYNNWPASSNFAGNNVPIDPKGNWSYCINTVSTLPGGANPISAPAPPTSSWGAGQCTNIPNCGGCNGWAAFSTTAPAATITAWTLCASLETNGPAVYCRYSKQ